VASVILVYWTALVVVQFGGLPLPAGIAVMLLLCLALARDLRRDPLALRQRLATTVVERAIRTGVEQHGGVQFDLVTRHECDGRCAEGTRCPGDTTSSDTKTTDALATN
jgi:hypothetical protein